MTGTPHRVDSFVGAEIRRLRRAKGMSQEKLADTLGLTFQQVQKYEKGSNRVSASKLYEIAEALGPVALLLPPQTVGEVAPDMDAEADAQRLRAAVQAVPELALVPSLPRPLQRTVGELVGALAERAP